jgi:hypothetical protein
LSRNKCRKDEVYDHVSLYELRTEPKYEELMNHLKMWQNSSSWGDTNQNDIHDEIKSRLNSWNASYHLVQNLLVTYQKKKIIFLVVLYGCKTWSLNLKEEHRMRVFENSMLRKIFGPKREEDGSWRKLDNAELHSLYSSSNIVRVIKSRRTRSAEHGACMEEGRGVYRVLVGRLT